MGKAALVIIFNHKFNKNISPLRQLYKNRFSRIQFLVPFYDGTDEDVTPVYENSFFFQGYIAQGLKHFFKENFEHYLFVADDMILNPAINENNYTEYFKLLPDESFIPEIFSLHHFTNDNTLLFEHNLTAKDDKRKRFWWRTKDAYNFSPQKKGVEINNEIPSYQEAEQRLAQHGYQIKPLNYWDIYGSLDPGADNRIKRIKLWQLIKHANLFAKKFNLSYPLVASYSDIVIVSKNTIQKFAHYCGVFAATNLFVEVAIPTALLLASGKVKTEPVIGKRGLLYWNYSPEQIARYENDMAIYNYSLHQLLEKFPADKLYIHPIKLSKWKTDLPQPSPL